MGREVGGGGGWVVGGEGVKRLQEQLEFIEDSKEFHDPDSSSSSSRFHVPHQSRIASSSTRKLRREYKELRKTREDMRNSGNVFACQPARQDPDKTM